MQFTDIKRSYDDAFTTLNVPSSNDDVDEESSISMATRMEALNE